MVKSFLRTFLLFASLTLILWVSFYFDFEQRDYSFMLENCACGTALRSHGTNNHLSFHKDCKPLSPAAIAAQAPLMSPGIAGVATYIALSKPILSEKQQPFANKAPPRQS